MKRLISQCKRKILNYNQRIYFSDIVARLARSSSESEYDGQEISPGNNLNFFLAEEDFKIDFKENLQEFEDTVPRYLKNKKIRPQKRKTKKERSEGKLKIINLKYLFLQKK